MRLVNADGTVIASTSVAEIDKSLTATPQPLDRTARARVAETGGVEVMLAPYRRRLIGYVRVCGVTESATLRPQRCGFLYLRHSLNDDRRYALWALQRQTLANAAGIALGAALLWWLLQVLLTRRARHLVARAGAFVAGDRTARARLSGNDELAQISRSLDRLLDTVVAVQASED